MRGATKVRLFRNMHLAIGLSLFVCRAPLFSQEDDDEKRIPAPRAWRPIAYSHIEIAAGRSPLRPNDSPIGYLTDRANGNGTFAELRLSIYDESPDKPSPCFIMCRFSYNDWGKQKIVGLASKEEQSKTKLTAATIGFAFSTIPYEHRFGVFISLECGVERWDIDASLPALADMRFLGAVQRAAGGVQSYGFFIEWAKAVHLFGQGGRRFTSRLGEDAIDKSEHWDPSTGRYYRNYHWFKDTGTWDCCMGYRHRF